MPTLETDLRVGMSNPDPTIEDATWDHVIAAITALDGSSHTLIIVGQPDGSWISVGGGTDGQYVVAAKLAAADFERYFTLQNPHVPEDEAEVLLSIGGQHREESIRIVVDLPLTLRAARKFFISGQLDPDLTWDEA